MSDFDAVRVVLDKALNAQDLGEHFWETEEHRDEWRAACDDLYATVELLDPADRQRLRHLADTLTAVTE